MKTPRFLAFTRLIIVVEPTLDGAFTWRAEDAYGLIVKQSKAYRRLGNCMNAATRAQAAATPKLVHLKKS
jgi:hypothetical protein